MNFKCLWNIWRRWVTSNYIFFSSFLCVSVQTHGHAVTFMLRKLYVHMNMHMWRSKVNLRSCALGLVHLGFCNRVSHWELNLSDWACLAVQGTQRSFYFCYPNSGIIIVPPYPVFYLVTRNRTQVGHHDYMAVTLLRSLSSYLSPLLFLPLLHCVGDWIQDTVQAEQFYQWVLLQSTYC